MNIETSAELSTELLALLRDLRVGDEALLKPGAWGLRDVMCER